MGEAQKETSITKRDDGKKNKKKGKGGRKKSSYRWPLKGQAGGTNCTRHNGLV